MKLYVAACNRELAERTATMFTEAGHTVLSTWHTEAFLPTVEYTIGSRVDIARRDVDEVTASDAVVMLASPTKVAGGKFVEVGVALGQGKTVCVIGRRENMLMWHPLVLMFDTVEQCIDAAQYGALIMGAPKEDTNA
jgi:nucleoside 2-deoxyribosyltransferase